MSRLRAAFPWLLRLGLAGLFAYAAVGKLRDPSAFAREIANYQLLPDLASHVAVALPGAELVAAIAILVPDARIRRAGALALAVLLVVLLIAVTSVVVRGVNVDCGCFGGGGYDPDAASQYPWEIARDAALLGASLFLVAAGHRSRWALDHVLFRRTPLDRPAP